MGNKKKEKKKRKRAKRVPTVPISEISVETADDFREKREPEPSPVEAGPQPFYLWTQRMSCMYTTAAGTHPGLPYGAGYGFSPTNEISYVYTIQSVYAPPGGIP